MTTDTPKKPLLRGRIHQIAFYKTILLTLLFTFLAIKNHHFSIELFIYFFSQLLLYGVSSTYHLKTFKTERMRRLFQKLDHSSIFILISGTQTSVFLSLLPEINLSLLVTTWCISFLGILKIFVFSNIIEILDVVIYIMHGVCVIPFFGYLIDHVGVRDWILLSMGGILYIVGGIIFGMGRPDPWPEVFGYHEIFHLLTVQANICFMVPILFKYAEKIVK